MSHVFGKKSSSLHSCHYDKATNEMHIKFLSGGTHAYKCNEAEFEALKAADSPGRHFHARIRDKFKERKV